MKEIKRGAEREEGREQQAIEREVKRKAYKEREVERERETQSYIQESQYYLSLMINAQN